MLASIPVLTFDDLIQINQSFPGQLLIVCALFLKYSVMSELNNQLMTRNFLPAL